MKTKLKLSTGTVLLLVASMTCALAQLPGAGASQTVTPATGLSVSAPQQFDPTTGLPMAPAVPEWKDANWKDPDITLTDVSYDNLPLAEVARWLTKQFKEQFDVLLPGNASSTIAGNGQVIPTAWANDWHSEPVTLRLKNVTASEIFAAMNLLFENDRTPLRWELKLNGHRQIALLRVLVDPTPQGNVAAEAPAPKPQRRVYFVGNLIGDEKNGGMTMEQIIKTITDVWKMADASSGNIQFHQEAQLLVITGTPGQIDFMEQTLKALGQKAELERNERIQRAATSGGAKSISPSR